MEMQIRGQVAAKEPWICVRHRKKEKALIASEVWTKWWRNTNNITIKKSKINKIKEMESHPPKITKVCSDKIMLLKSVSQPLNGV